MRRRDTSPYYVTYSKAKVIFVIGLNLLLAFFFIALGSALLVVDLSPSFIIVSIFLFIPSIGCIWLAIYLFSGLRDDRPIAVLTTRGFAGRRLFRNMELPWTPTTELIKHKNIISLKNPPENPDIKRKLRELWKPKHIVGISNGFAAQNAQDIEKAVARLNPYAKG